MSIDRSKISMRKVKLPEQIKFVSGEVREGVLEGIVKVRLESGGITSRYVMRSLNGRDRFQFLGTYMLNQMLSPDMVGHYLEITCVGEDANVQRNGRKMMVFEVACSEHPVMPVGNVGQKLEDGTYITDADVPF